MLNRWFTRHPASRPPRRFLLTLLAALLALGWVIHDDYGFAWDEFNDRNLGTGRRQTFAEMLAQNASAAGNNRDFAGQINHRISH